MLWLIIFLLWGFRTAFSGHTAGKPAMNVILALLVLLGILQMIVSLINAIQSVEAWLELQ
jgi:hypothetical protein